MPQNKIVPTRANLLKLKDNLKLTTEGFELLDQKREVLMMELMNVIYRLRDVQEKVRKSLAGLYNLMDESRLDIGYEEIDRISLGIQGEESINVVERSVMGVALPQITRVDSSSAPGFGLTGTTSVLDIAAEKAKALIPDINKWAELHMTVYRLAAEIHKTQRRVNALENIFIPEYKESVRYITTSLEESEREEFFRRKMVKKKMK